MNAAMENYNYWNDPRVIAGIAGKPRIEETPKGNFIIFTTEDEEGVEEEHRLSCKWEVCPLCDGNGRHVNPSIDASGITHSEWEEWEPDDREMYMNGGYDVSCTECKGRRVVPELDRENNAPELVKKYDAQLEQDLRDARESAAERSMGA